MQPTPVNLRYGTGAIRVHGARRDGRLKAENGFSLNSFFLLECIGARAQLWGLYAFMGTVVVIPPAL